MMVLPEIINTPWFLSVCEERINAESVKGKYLELCSPVILSRRQIRCLENPMADHVIKKIFHYIYDHPKVLYQVFTCNAVVTKDDPFTYAPVAIGGALIPVMKKLVESGVFLNHATDMLHYPPGIGPIIADMTPSLIGAAIGVGIIGALNLTRNIYKITHDQATFKWEENRKQWLKKVSRLSVLKDDNVLQYFLCTQTGEIPECPVRAPNNLTYNKSSIEEILDQGKTPKRCGRWFPKEDLRFDYAHANTVTIRMNEIIMAIRSFPQLLDKPFVPEFVRSYVKIREKVVVSLRNETGAYAKLVQDSSDYTDKVIAKKGPDERERILEVEKEHFAKMAHDMHVVNQSAVKVAVCTNNWIEKVGISLFGWAGVRKRIAYVDVLPVFFPNISKARDERLKIS